MNHNHAFYHAYDNANYDSDIVFFIIFAVIVAIFLLK